MDDLIADPDCPTCGGCGMVREWFADVDTRCDCYFGAAILEAVEAVASIELEDGVT